MKNKKMYKIYNFVSQDLNMLGGLSHPHNQQIDRLRHNKLCRSWLDMGHYHVPTSTRPTSISKSNFWNVF